MAEAAADAREVLPEARAVLEVGRAGEAIAACRRVLRHYPDAIAARRLLGAALRATGQRDEACRCFEHALAADPCDATAHLGPAALAEDAGDEAGALTHLRLAHEVAPALPAARDALARLDRGGRVRLSRVGLVNLHARNEDLPRAIREFRALLGEQPARPDLPLAWPRLRGGTRRTPRRPRSAAGCSRAHIRRAPCSCWPRSRATPATPARPSPCWRPPACSTPTPRWRARSTPCAPRRRWPPSSPHPGPYRPAIPPCPHRRRTSRRVKSAPAIAAIAASGQPVADNTDVNAAESVSPPGALDAPAATATANDADAPATAADLLAAYRRLIGEADTLLPQIAAPTRQLLGEGRRAARAERLLDDAARKLAQADRAVAALERTLAPREPARSRRPVERT